MFIQQELFDPIHQIVDVCLRRNPCRSLIFVLVRPQVFKASGEEAARFSLYTGRHKRARIVRTLLLNCTIQEVDIVEEKEHYM